MHISPNNPVVFSPQVSFNDRAKDTTDVQTPAESSKKSGNSQELSEEQRAQVAKLKSRDRTSMSLRA